MKAIKRLFTIITCFFLGICLVSCNIEKAFIFSGDTELSSEDIESFKGTKNAIFFALYNYYGYEGQHFTNKWLGMNDALAEHGIKVTGYEGEKDARKFKIERLATCDLPDDAVIYMVNNQSWDSGIQYSKPFAKYHPMAVISTCNGVEFAASNILASGDAISNATMGGFSKEYREAFENGSLKYLSAKYTAHILPIVAAAVDAVDKGKALRNADGTALQLSITSWAIQTLSQYDEMSNVDSISKEHPTVRKINVDKFFDESDPSYGAEKLAEWVSDSSKENIKALYEENGTNALSDQQAKRTGPKIKCGLLVPSSINSQVQSYINYIKGYMADIYNLEMLPDGAISSTKPQNIAAQELINSGAQIIISLQDDTDRNKAIEICNKNKVYFAIGGTCQNDIDYEVVKNLPYYVGSIGTSIQEERRSAKEMTNYYLECMIHRAKGDLEEFQKQYKGLE